MLKEQLCIPEQRLVIEGPQQIRDGPLLDQAQALMHAERLSAGGNIKDKTREDFESLICQGGQLWGWVENSTVLSAQTFELKQGNRSWWYLNNGVTRPDMRGRGITSQLLACSIRANEQPGVGFIVIYVRQNLFERLGFREVTPDDLEAIDKPIGAIIRGKLRQGKEAHILIKL